MSDPIKPHEPPSPLGNRKKIGPVDTEPEDSRKALEALTPQQQALREAAIRKFKINRVKKYVAQQVKYLNPNRQIGDSIRFLFDKYGKPPSNLPLEDIVEERKAIEAQIHWLEAICELLRDNLAQVKEIEDHALEYMAQGQDEE